jgi:hypothetical protein
VSSFELGTSLGGRAGMLKIRPRRSVVKCVVLYGLMSDFYTGEEKIKYLMLVVSSSKVTADVCNIWAIPDDRNLTR